MNFTPLPVELLSKQQGNINAFFFLDDSVVLKVITIYNKDTDTMEEVLLEELQVFKVLYF